MSVGHKNHDTFARRREVGISGESAISKWLQRRGHAVFPAYKVAVTDEKGPQMFALGGDLVLPDLLAFRDGTMIWFEAKHKTCCTWHRATSRWVTGIDLRHYGEYLDVSEITKLPVWLLFFHPQSEPSRSDAAHGCPPTSPTGLFGEDIRVLKGCENHRSDKWGKSGMVYWDVDSLKRLADASELQERAA